MGEETGGFHSDLLECSSSSSSVRDSSPCVVCQLRPPMNILLNGGGEIQAVKSAHEITRDSKQTWTFVQYKKQKTRKKERKEESIGHVAKSPIGQSGRYNPLEEQWRLWGGRRGQRGCFIFQEGWRRSCDVAVCGGKGGNK